MVCLRVANQGFWVILLGIYLYLRQLVLVINFCLNGYCIKHIELYIYLDYFFLGRTGSEIVHFTGICHEFTDA